MTKLTNAQRTWLRKQIIIEVACLPEDTPVEGNALASGDALEDRKAELEIIRQLHAGNEWAWCLAKVTARWLNFSGSAYLGGCSYESQADFERCEVEQLSAEAFDDLVRTIESALESAEELRTILRIQD